MQLKIIKTPQIFLQALKRVHKLKRTAYTCLLVPKLNSLLTLCFENNLIAGYYSSSKKIKIKNQFVCQTTIFLKYGPNGEQPWQNCLISQRSITWLEIKWLQKQNLSMLIQTSKTFLLIKPTDPKKVSGTLVALIT